jgi:hypothetical protein
VTGRGPADETEASAPGRRRATAAIVLATVAALFSVGALGVSLGLYLERGLPGTSNGAARPGPQLIATIAPEPEPVQSDAIDPQATTPGWVDPAAHFSPAYADQVLTVQLPPCGTALTRYVDLDEPRVGVDVGSAELYYEFRSGCNGATQLNLLDGVGVAVVPKPTLTPAECTEALRNAPANEPVLISPKLTVCLTTSATRAADLGVTQKVVVLAVTAIGPDSTATLRANAWDIMN